MDDIKRVLVAVDLTEMDEKLVRYIAMLSNAVKLDKVYFFNVLKNMELPESISEKYPNLLAPLDEATKKEIQYTIDEEAGNQLKADYEIKVTEGNRAEQILKWAKIKDVDIIIMGRKSTLPGEGIVSTKVVRLPTCSVALIPEEIPRSFQKIIVPMDFSNASELAFEFAINLASKIPGTSIVCFNAYTVPSGYHTSGKSYEEFAEIMKSNAQESYNLLIKNYDTKGVAVEVKFVLDEKDSISKKIYQFSMDEGVSAIVIGSKGRTQAAAIILGSITEKLIRLDSTLPLVVVKQRKHNLNFLEALMNI